MASTNDITGDEIKTKVPSKAYKDNHDKIDQSWIREQVAKREAAKQK